MKSAKLPKWYATMCSDAEPTAAGHCQSTPLNRWVLVVAGLTAAIANLLAMLEYIG